MRPSCSRIASARRREICIYAWGVLAGPALTPLYKPFSQTPDGSARGAYEKNGPLEHSSRASEEGPPAYPTCCACPRVVPVAAQERGRFLTYVSGGSRSWRAPPRTRAPGPAVHWTVGLGGRAPVSPGGPLFMLLGVSGVAAAAGTHPSWAVSRPPGQSPLYLGRADLRAAGRFVAPPGKSDDGPERVSVRP